MDFVKMQATGNDFVLIDARGLERDWSKLALSLCHRQLGIGGDGLLLLLPSEKASFRMRMFNPDGSEAEACGNGLRCFAKYAVEEGLVSSAEFEVETMAGLRTLRVSKEGDKVTRVEVTMGTPRLAPADIPISVGNLDMILDYPLDLGGRELKVTCVSMGNPHAVLFSKEPVADFPLEELGPRVEHHPLFPQRTNFEVANVISRGEVVARVWERGAGQTLSCGSGACAIAVAARLHGYTERKIDIKLPGGTLTIDWDGEREVMLSGPAETVFTGRWVEDKELCS